MATIKVLKMELETDSLAPQQVRLIKQLNHLMIQLSATLDEEEYFHLSAEMIRLSASLIKQCQFTSRRDNQGIPYGDQALEYALDSLNEHIQLARVVNFDN